jgi:glycolate oxidase FAD binding subunit
LDIELQSFGACIAEAHAASRPLRLRGAGTKDFYGEHCEGDVLDLSHYQGIVDYDPSELVLTARCGTRLSVIESLLSQNRQCVAFEPPAFAGDPTLGGIVAAGLSGPQRVRAGAARDFVLGAALIAIDGELLHFGGRVMKNVAGFDVARLLCGSLGILGPIVEVSMKVLPLPRAQQTLCFEMSALQALQAFNTWAGKPLPICASAWIDNRAWIRLAGAPAALAAACKQLGGEPIDASIALRWWQSVRDHTHDFFRGIGMLWRVSLPPTAAPWQIAASPVIDPFIEWGGALRWYAQDLPASRLRAEAAALGGTASLWHGGAPGQRFHPLDPAVLKIHRQLKAQFDPHRIFNRGRLVADL